MNLLWMVCSANRLKDPSLRVPPKYEPKTEAWSYREGTPVKCWRKRSLRNLDGPEGSYDAVRIGRTTL